MTKEPQQGVKKEEKLLPGIVRINAELDRMLKY